MQAVLPHHKYYYWGPYLASMEANPDYCARLLKLGKKLKQSHRKNLAGQIKYEYLYDLQKEPWIFNEFQIYINTWIDGFKNFADKPQFNPRYQLVQMWINRMKAKEYNPIHIHTHCDLSFVLWLEVPPCILREAKKNETEGPDPGNISFFYGEDRWNVVSTRSFVPKVNTLMMFPAYLRHQVMHFDSKVIRTSAAGNIKFV